MRSRRLGGTPGEARLFRLRTGTAALLLLATVAACGGDNPTGGRLPTTQSSGPVSGTIRVQAAGGEGEMNALREMVTAFEASHPGTKVELTALAAQGEHISKLGTAFAGGNPPDVFLLNYRRFGRFAKQGVLDPPDLPGVVSDYYQPPLEAFTFGGQLLCLPQNASSTVAYVNPGLFAKAGVPLPKAGWTIEDLKGTVSALRAKGVKTIGFEPSFRSVPPFVWALGGEVVDDTANPKVITLGTEQGRAALTTMKGLLDDGGVSATDAAAAPAEDRFADGELAILLDSRRAVPAFRKAGVDFDVVPLPKGTAEATLLASDAYCVSKASKNIGLARAFAAYAVGPEGGAVLARSGRTVPSLKSLAASKDFLAPEAKPKSSKVFLDVLEHARRLPNVGQWNEAENTASEALEQFFAGKASVEDTVKQIEDDSERILAQES